MMRGVLLQGCGFHIRRALSPSLPYRGPAYRLWGRGRWQTTEAAARRGLEPNRPIKVLLQEFHHQPSPTASREEDSEPTIVRTAGYIKSIRAHGKVTFVDLTDGSLPAEESLQVVVKGSSAGQQHLAVGDSVELVGAFKQSKGPAQVAEFVAQHVHITGKCETATYPLAVPSSQTTPNLLRKYAHLRSRNPRHASVLRSRNMMERAISDYFWEKHFIRVAAPLITSSDCEGGGEVFSVDAAPHQAAEGGKEDAVDAAIAQEPSLSGSTADGIDKVDDEAEVDPSSTSSSFWSSSSAYLTVSSQLHLEAMSYGLGKVYTIGPSFRAESSATNRHLVEFWMCEAEMTTSNDAHEGLESIMTVVEELVKAVTTRTIESEETTHLWKGDEECLGRLQQYVTNTWPRVSYTDAIAELGAEKDRFGIPSPRWGESLASEHERWLARNGPIFVTHYPSSIKPFYMRRDDGDTVACFDLLVPRIGELVGGSLREERADVLLSRVSPSSPPQHLQWYTQDLRRYGCGPHGGFGIGMERLLSWITKTENLRDCVTFPRVKGPIRY